MKQMLICAFLFYSTSVISMEDHSELMSSEELTLCKKIYQCNMRAHSTDTLVIPELQEYNVVDVLTKHKKQLLQDKENLPTTQMHLGIEYGAKIRNGRLLALIGFGLIGNELLNPSPYMALSCGAALLCIVGAKYQFKRSVDIWHEHRSLPLYIQSTQTINSKLLDILSKAPSAD